MKTGNKRRGTSKAQTIGIVIVSILAITSFMATALFAGGQLTLEMFGFSGGDDGGYRNITLTDAQLICEKEAHDEFAQRLKMITVDSHSSRYDEKSNRYKMFFDLDMYPKRGKEKSIATNHFLNCFVHGSRGTITHFESVEDTEEESSPIRQKGGNLFGF